MTMMTPADRGAPAVLPSPSAYVSATLPTATASPTPTSPMPMPRAPIGSTEVRRARPAARVCVCPSSSSTGGSVAVSRPHTHTWHSLLQRQARLMSAASEVESRLEGIARRLAHMGWKDTRMEGRQIVEGAEWSSLASRQHRLLQRICGVKDRMKTLQFKVGLTNAAYDECISMPQLATKVPSHFNNAQLGTFLREGYRQWQQRMEGIRDSSNSSMHNHPPSLTTPLYPLNKLLVIVGVRDLHRFIESAGWRVYAELAQHRAPGEESVGPNHSADATAAHAASSASALAAAATTSASHSPHPTAASPSPSISASVAPLSPSTTAAPSHSELRPLPAPAAVLVSPPSLRSLVHLLFFHLCGLELSEDSLDRMLRDGPRLAKMSLQVDRATRIILHEEEYRLPQFMTKEEMARAVQLQGQSNDDAVATPADHATSGPSSHSVSSSHSSMFDPDLNVRPSAAFTHSLHSFQAKQGRSWFLSGASPFAKLKFSRDPHDLSNATRTPCEQCHRQVALYCPYCLCVALPKELRIPTVKLPVQVDIIHHVGENVKKSTSIHAAVLAGCEQVRFLEFPRDVPQYDPATTLLLYPTNDAVLLDSPALDTIMLGTGMGKDGGGSGVRTLVLIESTWTKSDSVVSHPSICSLRRVRIRAYESTFWRYQELGRQFLATLEAIYYACLEIQQRKERSKRNDASMSSVSSSPALNSTSPPSSHSPSPSSDASESNDSAPPPPPPAAYAVPSSSVTSLNFDDLFYFYAFQHGVIRARYKDPTKYGSAPRSWSGGLGAKEENIRKINSNKDGTL